MKKILILVLLLFINFIISLSAFAEVLMDGTMGTAGKINGPYYDIKAEYGQQSGTNLFHSFEQFNVNTGETANFGVSSETQNIISRVTGGNRSWIDGTLSSTIAGTSQLSSANLYLLNPSGVLFGANASLNLGGSFHVSTADYLRMGKYEQFYTAQANEVLSVSPPAAFGFLDKEVSPITFEGETSDTPNLSKGLLSVPTGETLSIIGGDIWISGTYYHDENAAKDVPLPRLKASEGDIHVVSVASEGEVVLNQPSEVLETWEGFKTGNITLNHAHISTSGEGSGNILIRCGTFFADNSVIEADTIGNKDGGLTDIQADTLVLSQSDIFSDTKEIGRGGDIVLRIRESADISDHSKIFADATGEGMKTSYAGTVLIEAKNISLDNGAMVSAETYGKSRGGSVTLRADEEIRLSNESQIFSRTTGYEAENMAGEAGSVIIETKDISLSERSLISSDTYSNAGGGNILISGKDGAFPESVHISDSHIYAGSYSSGNGGVVEIKGKHITFTEGGIIGSESFDKGKGGDINIYASESLSFSSSDHNEEASNAYTSALGLEEDSGDAGNIFIKTDTLTFKNGGEITASTNGPGNAGSIELEVGSLTLDTNASVSSASTSKGKGGNAGTIVASVEDTISLKNQSVITTSTSGKGNAGAITLETANLMLNNRSSVSSASTSDEQAGDAGTILIQTDNAMTLSGNSAITTEAANAGKGQIRIETAGSVYMLNGMITTSIRKGEEDAGDIYAAQDHLILNHSKIIANAWEGKGGNIHLIANPFIRSSDSLVDASSKLGIDGTVYIEAPDEDVSKGLTNLPDDFPDVSQWLKTPCSARSRESISRFVLSGRDGIPGIHMNMLPGILFMSDSLLESEEKEQMRY